MRSVVACGQCAIDYGFPCVRRACRQERPGLAWRSSSGAVFITPSARLWLRNAQANRPSGPDPDFRLLCLRDRRFFGALCLGHWALALALTVLQVARLYPTGQFSFWIIFFSGIYTFLDDHWNTAGQDGPKGGQ